MSHDRFLSLLTGSFSTPAGANPTVAMVEAAYRQLGLDARYINCDVTPEHLGDAVGGARAMGWAGFNCSLPHKVAVMEHLDAVADSARIIGAVNCVVNREGHLIGENTDGRGFLASLRDIIDPKGRRVAILGAGGAARAIAVELALAGAGSIDVVNRDKTRGDTLAALVRERLGGEAAFSAWEGAFRVLEETEILVNATSVGLAPEAERCPDVDFDTLRPGLVVADVIPNPPRTALLREAERRGCLVLDGLGMLVNQAVAGIGLWMGLTADRVTMREAIGAIEPTEDRLDC